MKMKITMGNCGWQGKRAILGNMSYNWSNFDKLRFHGIPIHLPLVPSSWGSVLLTKGLHCSLLCWIEIILNFNIVMPHALRNMLHSALVSPVQELCFDFGSGFYIYGSFALYFLSRTSNLGFKPIK